ncbi:MAG: hypothetical protein Q8L92_08270, partial [Rubrivivax sp.]|nr:hypothetical protein [Rubrivivax sp.]
MALDRHPGGNDGHIRGGRGKVHHAVRRHPEHFLCVYDESRQCRTFLVAGAVSIIDQPGHSHGERIACIPQAL